MANLRANNLTGTGGRNAIDGSISFKSENAYLSTTIDAIGTSDFTIEWWFKATDKTEPGTANRRVFRLGANNATGSISINYDAVNNDIQWNYNDATLIGASTIGIYDNSWYHIAAVREGTGSNETKLYINGVLSDSATLSQDLTQTAVQIGHDSTLSDDFGFYGDISNLRVTKSAVYTAAFTPPTEKLTILTDTILLCCQDSDDPTQEATGKTITEVGDPVGSTYFPSVGVDEGVTFEGDIKMNSQGYMYFPTGITEQRGRGRGLTGGGWVTPGTATATIQSIQIQSDGISNDFGDLTVARMSLAPMSSATRGLFAGGYTPTKQDTIDYVEIATTGNAIDFGNMLAADKMSMGASNSTRGLLAGGDNNNVIQYVTMASTGNATDFGDLLNNSKYGMGCASPTRAIWFMGSYPSNINTIEYTTIATTGNSTDFGDRLYTASFGGAACASSTRALSAGGYNHPTINQSINYVEIATTGNATDFGDLTKAIGQGGSGMSNGSRGVFGGYWGPTTTGAGGQGETNICEYVTIAAKGNARDWGDLYQQTYYSTGVSDSHGGLS